MSRILGDKGRPFKAGARQIGAKELNETIDCIPRQIVGDNATIDVRRFGDRLIISAIPQPKLVDEDDIEGYTGCLVNITEADWDSSTCNLTITYRYDRYEKGNLKRVSFEQADICLDPNAVDGGEGVDSDTPCCDYDSPGSNGSTGG